MLHQLSAGVKFAAQLVVPITAATNTPAAGVDTLGYRRALALFHSKPTGSGTTSDCKLQESSDDGSGDAYADVTGATFAQVTTAGGEKIQVMEIDLAKRERYLKLIHTGAGGSAAGAAEGCILLFRGAQEPPTQAATVVSV